MAKIKSKELLGNDWVMDIIYNILIYIKICYSRKKWQVVAKNLLSL